MVAEAVVAVVGWLGSPKTRRLFPLLIVVVVAVSESFAALSR